MRPATWAWPVLVAVVSFLSFLPALGNGFVDYDDDVNFTDNPFFRGFSQENLRWMFTDSFGHFMPLSWMSLALDYEIWGLNPRGYHLTSMLLHAVNAALLYLLIGRLVGPGAGAAIGALFFAVHPLRVESVAWATERRDVLSGLFLLLCLLAYVHHAQQQGGIRWLVLSAVFFACSLLSKALGMMLPAVLLVMDAYPLRRRIGARVLCEKIPFLIVAAGGAAISLAAVADPYTQSAPTPWIDRALQPGYRLMFYAGKIVVPEGLSPLYLYRPIQSWVEPKYLLGLGLAVAVTAALVAWRRRWPAVLAAWAAFVLMILPVLGWVQVGPHFAADRYTYLPAIPWAVLLAAGMRRRGLVVGAAAVLALAVMTVRQTTFWKDSLTLWDRVLAVDPGNEFALVHRGIAQTDPADARADFEAALAANPGFAWAQDALGVLHLRDGDDRTAIHWFTAAIRNDPASDAAYCHRGHAWRDDLPRARDDFSAAVHLNPRNAGAWAARARVHYSMGDRSAAFADAREAIRRNPLDAESLRLRGTLFLESGQAEAAVADFDAVLRLRPDDFEARVWRGFARMQVNQIEAGTQDLEAASALLPGPVTRYLVRAMGLFAKGDFKMAAIDAEHARDQSEPGSEVRRRAEELIKLCRAPR